MARSAPSGCIENGVRSANAFARAAFQAWPSVQGVDRLIREAANSSQVSVLAKSLDEISRALGFRFYVLRSNDGWELANLGDPPQAMAGSLKALHERVAVASENMAHGFLWSETLPALTRVEDDSDVVWILAGAGWGDGFTVPVHVPGRRPASFSFITARGNRPLRANLPMAQYVATAAFDAVHQIRARGHDVQEVANGIPHLTSRQRDCILLAARGKSDTEAAKLLGISSDTVHQHLEAAKHRYHVATRAELIVRVLFDGQIPFEAILRN